MYGYIVPDKPNMYMKDFSLYKAYYCGLCKAIGKKCGQIMRLTTSYDMTFFSAFAHIFLDIETEFSNEGCILNPIKKKSIIKKSEITDIIVDINTLLIFYKVQDDIIDSKSAKKKLINAAVIKSKYNKAKINLPELDNFFNAEYEKLRKLEGDKCASIDRLADPFANMLTRAMQEVCKDKFNNYVKEIFYNIGRWVYIADAIDDIEKDYKKNNFNPFLVEYKFESKEKFLQDKHNYLEFLLISCYSKIESSYAEIKGENFGLITNILWYGILNESFLLLRGEKTTKI